MSVSTQLELDELLTLAAEKKASDLHLSVGKPPVLRIDGKLVVLSDKETLTPDRCKELVLLLLNDKQKEILSREREIDFSYNYKDLFRFRGNAFHERGRLSVALRLITKKIRTLEELNLPPILERFVQVAQGFVLMVGPAGCGKSTTLASLVDSINHTRTEHIITIEDPIEYIFEHDKSIIDQREVYSDTLSFPRALRSVLREDPNVVLIGEMRDLETISAALTIAETGHLVLATLHTNTASQTVDRIIDAFPPYQQPQIRSQLASTITGVISERLIPRIGGGRVPACEIMIANPAIRNLIREGKIYQVNSVIQTSGEKGMIPLDKSLATLVKEGAITKADALLWSVDGNLLESFLKEL